MRRPALPPLQRVPTSDPAIGALLSRLRSRDHRYADQPKPGFWKMRVVRGGPEVPACIRVIHTTYEPDEPANTMERSPFLAAFIAGEPVGLDRVWTWARIPISEPEYEFRLAELQWAQRHSPQEPIAQPRRRIDLMQAPLPF